MSRPITLIECHVCKTPVGHVVDCYAPIPSIMCLRCIYTENARKDYIMMGGTFEDDWFKGFIPEDSNSVKEKAKELIPLEDQYIGELVELYKKEDIK